MRDITIGRYYDVPSTVHELDPRLKLIFTLFYISLLFVFRSVFSLTGVIMLMLFIISLSNVPIKYILRGVKPIVFIIVFTVALNIFMTGGKVIFEFYFIKITVEGLIRAGFMGLRLLMLIIGGSMLTYTTPPIRLSDAIEELLKPLAKIKLPAHEIAMMMTIALRFIPTLMEETDKIIKAQLARGANFESKNIIKKAKSFLPIMVPLFVNSLKRAEDLAVAMEARCYHGSEGRTRYKKLKYSKKDAIAFLCISFIFVSLFCVDFLTGSDFAF